MPTTPEIVQARRDHALVGEYVTQIEDFMLGADVDKDGRWRWRVHRGLGKRHTDALIRMFSASGWDVLLEHSAAAEAHYLALKPRETAELTPDEQILLISLCGGSLPAGPHRDALAKLLYRAGILGSRSREG